MYFLCFLMTSIFLLLLYKFHQYKKIEILFLILLITILKKVFQFFKKMDSECPICYEIIAVDNNKAITECGHSFHLNCLMTNVQINGFSCPLCRNIMGIKKCEVINNCDGDLISNVPLPYPNFTLPIDIYNDDTTMIENYDSDDDTVIFENYDSDDDTQDTEMIILSPMDIETDFATIEYEFAITS